MRVHLCDERGCHRVIPLNQRYCEEHAKLHVYKRPKLNRLQRKAINKKYDKLKRNPTATKFYHSKQWKMVREFVYSREYGTCQACGRVTGNRKIVDHVVPRRLCRNPLATNNLWLLCYRCHHIKTELEEKMSDQKLMSMTEQGWKAKIRQVSLKYPRPQG